MIKNANKIAFYTETRMLVLENMATLTRSLKWHPDWNWVVEQLRWLGLESERLNKLIIQLKK